MTSEPTSPPAGTWRVVLAITSIGIGIVAATIVGVAVISAGGWKIDVPATDGSELGRTAMQVATGAELDDHRIPLGIGVLLNVPLWIGLVGGPLWARRRGLDWRRDLGWSVRWSDVPTGLAIGVAVQLVAIPLLYEPIFWLFGDQDVEAVARNLVAAADTPFDVAALLALTVVGAPIAEEILYRGVLFRGLVDMSAAGRAGLTAAVAGSAALFAASHFQALQFPGLLLFGIVAALVFQRTGRLGTAIWVHVGFNLTTVTALLFDIY